MPNLKIFWDSVPNAASYNLYYRTSPGVTISNGTPIVGIQDIVYHHKHLADGTTYYYLVVAVDLHGNLGTPSIEFGAAASTATALSITPTNAVHQAGETQQYIAEIIYSSGNTTDVTSSTLWDTSNHAIATINSNGLATSVSIGTADIIGTYNSVIGSAPLIVHHTLLSISITPSPSPSVNVASTLQFTATGHYNDFTTSDITDLVTWSSTDTGKATIDGYGLATGVFHGTTSIGATLGLTSATPVTLTVNAVLTSVIVTPTNPSIPYPNSQQFTAIAHYNDASTVDVTNTATWQSATPGTATVDSAGFATSVHSGTSLISATVGLISGNTTLTVTHILQSIVISPTNTTLFFIGNTQQYTATGTYNDSDVSNVTGSATWASTNPTVATINSSGLATAATFGATNISATIGLIVSNTAILDIETWSIQTSGTSQNLTGVWGFASNNVYAVGNNGVILHWDGYAWAQQTSGTAANFLGVQGPNAGHVYAWADDHKVYITHNNGTTWSQSPVDPFDYNPHGFWANTPNDIWTTFNGSRVNYSSTELTSMVGDLDGNIGSGGGTTFLYGFGPNDMFMGMGNSGHSEIMHYTGGAKRGSSWSDITPGMTALTLDFGITSMWGTSDSNLYVTGGFFNGGGIVYTNNNFSTFTLWTNSSVGHAATSLPSDTGSVRSVSGSGSLSLTYAASSHGNDNKFVVLSKNGALWVEEFSGYVNNTAHAICIWTDETTGYSVCVGENGSILKKGTSDNTPKTVIGLLHWVKADYGVGVDGSGNVTVWVDQTGAGHNWVPGSGTVQLITNAQNELPVIRSTDTVTDNYLQQSAFISGSQQAEMFVVLKANIPGVNYAWGGFGSDLGNLSHYPYAGTDIYESFGNTTRQGPFNVANSGNATRAYGIYNVSSGSGVGNYVVRLNGTQLGTGTATPGWDTTFRLFAGGFNQSFQFVGDIGEVLIYDHVLSTTDRNAIYNYLQNKWNTPNGV